MPLTPRNRLSENGMPSGSPNANSMIDTMTSSIASTIGAVGRGIGGGRRYVVLVVEPGEVVGVGLVGVLAFLVEPQPPVLVVAGQRALGVADGRVRVDVPAGDQCSEFGVGVDPGEWVGAACRPSRVGFGVRLLAAGAQHGGDDRARVRPLAGGHVEPQRTCEPGASAR